MCVVLVAPCVSYIGHTEKFLRRACRWLGEVRPLCEEWLTADTLQDVQKQY